MSFSISTLLTRNLHDVFGENDAARRRAAIDEIFTEGLRRYRDAAKALDDAVASLELIKPGFSLLLRWLSSLIAKNPLRYAAAGFLTFVARGGWKHADRIGGKVVSTLRSIIPKRAAPSSPPGGAERAMNVGKWLRPSGQVRAWFGRAVSRPHRSPVRRSLAALAVYPARVPDTKVPREP
jgi:hypothetical protein